MDEDGKVTKAINNATGMKHPVTKNKITIKAGAATKNKAVSLARGLTAAIIHYDEPEFTDFIKEIIENSVSTFDTAARAARNNGKLYGRVFTCTPKSLGELIEILIANLFNCWELSLSLLVQ